MRCDEQAMHMKQRQRVQKHVAGLPVPVVLQHFGVRCQVFMRQHGPFAAPGSAGGVQDCGKVVRLLLYGIEAVGLQRSAIQKGTRAVVVKGEDMAGAAGKCDLRYPAKVLRRTHDDRRLGVVDEILDLRSAIGGVEREVDKARTNRREVKQQRFRRFFHLHGDARILGQTESCQQICHLSGGTVEIVP
ncbi:hypothetical protein GCM10027343_16260 [Noviherbaspirillum agri]